MLNLFIENVKSILWKKGGRSLKEYQEASTQVPSQHPGDGADFKCSPSRAFSKSDLVP